MKKEPAQGLVLAVNCVGAWHAIFKGIIRLGCEVNNENVTEASFVLTLVMAGEFYAHDSPFEQYVVNAASLLFPYLRTYISTVTAMSGVEPLTIPALNMYELLASMNNDISE